MSQCRNLGTVFVMEGPSSSEDYVTNGVEERVGRRIIMPDEGVEVG